MSGSEPSGLSSRGRPSRTAESVRYGLLTPRHLLRPPRLHIESRGHTLLLGRHVLLQANHLEEEEEEEEEEGGVLGSQRGNKLGWQGAGEERQGER